MYDVKKKADCLSLIATGFASILLEIIFKVWIQIWFLDKYNRWQWSFRGFLFLSRSHWTRILKCR